MIKTQQRKGGGGRVEREEKDSQIKEKKMQLESIGKSIACSGATNKKGTTQST